MLFLLFQLEPDYYALETREIAEVLPLSLLKQLPGTPAWVAGLLDYHGQPVPIIDLCALALGRPARDRLSTRMVLVHYHDSDGGRQLLGLIVEKATEFLRGDLADFSATGVKTPAAPYLGPVLQDARGLIQRVDVAALLPPSVRELLYCEAR